MIAYMRSFVIFLWNKHTFWRMYRRIGRSCGGGAAGGSDGNGGLVVVVVVITSVFFSVLSLY